MKQMKLLSFILLPILSMFVLLLASCERTTVDVSKIVEERDSLIRLNSIQQRELENLDSCIFTISDFLDDIARQENMIKAQLNEGARMNPADMKKSFDELSNIMARQRSRISILEDSLNRKHSQSPELQKIISFLNSQMEVKENEIAQLKSKVNSQSRDIKVYKEYIRTANQKVAELTDDNKKQEEIISTQDKIINTGYIKIGTKKELSAAGLLSEKFLSSPKLVHANLTPSKCQAVDIRKTTEIRLNSKKPKILTTMPNNSYTIQKDADGVSSLLVIKDVALFWSQSNYLVILL